MGAWERDSVTAESDRVLRWPGGVGAWERWSGGAVERWSVGAVERGSWCRDAGLRGGAGAGMQD